MELAYDPKVGLILPKEPAVLAGPNPRERPPYDPVWDDRLRAIAQRLNRQLRFRWNPAVGCWCIQQLYPGVRGWEDECINYEEKTAHKGNRYPYRPIDNRFLSEFCEASLQLKYGTGDIQRDTAMRDSLKDKENEAEAARKDEHMTGLIHAIITGGDATRFEKYAQAERGVKYTEFFSVGEAIVKADP